jgi:hypothetical protein
VNRLLPLGGVVAAGLVAALVASCSPLVPTKPPDGGSGGSGGSDGGGPVLRDGGSDAGPPTPDGGLPLESACDVLNHQRCAYLQRCGLIGASGGDLERCEAMLVATWCGPSTWPARVVRAGTLRYDGRLAEDCAVAFASRPCAEFATLPDSCNAFLRPAANLGQYCYDGFQECIEGVCRSSACPRTCQPRGMSDDVCRQDSDCVPQLFCRRSTTSSGIGVCKAYAGIDEPCDAETRCLEGLWCLRNQCRQLPTAGAACLYGRCDELSWCDLSLDGGTCLPKKSLGASCLPGQCLPGLVCGALSGVCEVRALDQAGAPCTWEQTCPAGTVCAGWTRQARGTCEPPHGEGDACTRHEDCLAHLACLEGDGGRFCQRRLAEGETCADSRACGLLAACVQGRCTRLPVPGESCDETRACLWGPCIDAGAAGFVCTSPLLLDAACRVGSDCASGRCEMGRCLVPCTP